MSIDLDVINELKEIMGDDFDELISIFISDGQTQIENLKLSIQSSNVEDTRRFAHTLKGSSANLGLNALSESCMTLERNAAEGLPEDASELLENIINRYNTAKEILTEKL